MTTDNTQNNDEQLAKAVAVEYRAGILNDLSRMTPGQYEIAKQAVADFDNAMQHQAAKADDGAAFNRWVAHATQAEFDRFNMTGEWPGKR